MKLLAYILSLILSAFTYFLFVAYLSAAAGIESIWPIVCFYCSVFIFGLLSWLHFYMARSGMVLLTISTLLMFYSMPLHLMFDYFYGDEYKPSIVEWIVPLVLTILTIVVGWYSVKKPTLNKFVKLVLAIVPLAMAIYAGGYFTIRYFF